jgi:hypothetical protein
LRSFSDNILPSLNRAFQGKFLLPSRPLQKKEKIICPKKPQTSLSGFKSLILGLIDEHLALPGTVFPVRLMIYKSVE